MQTRWKWVLSGGSVHWNATLVIKLDDQPIRKAMLLRKAAPVVMASPMRVAGRVTAPRRVATASPVGASHAENGALRRVVGLLRMVGTVYLTEVGAPVRVLTRRC